MFSAIFFIVGMAIIFSVAIVSIVVYGIYHLFFTPNVPAVDDVARGRSYGIQH